MRRLAGEIFKKWKNDTMFQDSLETAIGAAVAAGGQAIFTDMSPEEIALSAIIGAGSAMAARPVAANAGFYLGRKLNTIDSVSKGFDNLMDDDLFGNIWGMTGHKGIKRARNGEGPIFSGMPEKGRNALLELLEAKNKLNYIRPDGTKRSELEGFLGKYGRSRGDNIVQGAIAIGTPFVIGSPENEEEPQ